jgi:CheY-like chemotaxis protein
MLDPRTTRVMIIDRDPRSVAQVQSLFGALGYLDTDSANSAAVAFQRLHNCDAFGDSAFKLIYLDWNLDAPANGSMVLEAIRGDYKIRWTRVIMCCEMRHVPYARYMIKEQLLDGMVMKPPTLASLRAAIEPLVLPMLPPFNV